MPWYVMLISGLAALTYSFYFYFFTAEMTKALYWLVFSVSIELVSCLREIAYFQQVSIDDAKQRHAQGEESYGRTQSEGH